MKINADQEVWLGLEKAYLPHVKLEQELAAVELNLPQAVAALERASEPGDWMISRSGAVGLLNVSGSMTNRTSIFSEMLSIPSYPEITAALYKLADDPEVKHIVLNLNTPGGRASGVAAVANAVEMVNRLVKPVTAHTTETLASAGYYIASQARSISTTAEAELGSIGAIAIHMEESQALKDEGITVTVLRTGKFKGIGNSAEPLTPEAAAELQNHLERTNDKFVAAVSAGRGMSEKNIRDMEGRTYAGDLAVRNGLADRVESLDSLVARLNAECNNPMNSKGGPQMKQMKILSEAALAALASGAPLKSLEADPAAEPTAPSAEAPAISDTPVVQEAQSEAAAEISPESDIVKFLRGELHTSQATIAELTAQVRQLERDSASVQGTLDALAAVARTSIERLQVAVRDLSGSPADLRPELLAEKFRALNEAFIKQFPVGRRTQEDDAPGPQLKAPAGAFQRAQLRSTNPLK